ncbi:hypothetical protein [Rohdeia mirabilis]
MNGSVSGRAGSSLGRDGRAAIDPRTLYEKLRRYDLRKEDFS